MEEVRKDLFGYYAQEVIDMVTEIIPKDSIKFDWSIIFDILIELFLDFLENCGKDRLEKWAKRGKNTIFRGVIERQVKRKLKNVPKELDDILPNTVAQWFVERFNVSDLALI